MARFSLTRLIDTERVIHSFKTVIAVLIGLLIIKLVDIKAGQWILITIIVVMCSQIYVGSVLQKSYFRFLGTLIGCLFAAFTIMSFGVTNVSIALAVAISSFVFSYIATGWENLTYAGTLGAVTTIIIMIGQDPTLLYALERFLEISLGILIASLVSQFILPIHARVHLRRAQALTLEKLRDYYETMLVKEVPIDSNFDYHDLDEGIARLLIKQRQLAKESKREPFAIKFDSLHFLEILYAEREILRAITFMHEALSVIPTNSFDIKKESVYVEFNKLILNALQILDNAIASGKEQNTILSIPTLQGLKTSIQLSQTTPETTFYLNSFLFAAEILIKNLKTVADLNNIVVQ